MFTECPCSFPMLLSMFSSSIVVFVLEAGLLMFFIFFLFRVYTSVPLSLDNTIPLHVTVSYLRSWAFPR